MELWLVIALVCYIVSCVLSVIQRAYALAFLAAGMGCFVVAFLAETSVFN